MLDPKREQRRGQERNFARRLKRKTEMWELLDQSEKDRITRIRDLRREKSRRYHAKNPEYGIAYRKREDVKKRYLEQLKERRKANINGSGEKQRAHTRIWTARKSIEGHMKKLKMAQESGDAEKVAECVQRLNLAKKALEERIQVKEEVFRKWGKGHRSMVEIPPQSHSEADD